MKLIEVNKKPHMLAIGEITEIFKEGIYKDLQIGRTKKGYFPYVPGFTGISRKKLEELSLEVGGINEIERVRTRGKE